MLEWFKNTTNPCFLPFEALEVIKAKELAKREYIRQEIVKCIPTIDPAKFRAKELRLQLDRSNEGFLKLYKIVNDYRGWVAEEKSFPYHFKKFETRELAQKGLVGIIRERTYQHFKQKRIESLDKKRLWAVERELGI